MRGGGLLIGTGINGHQRGGVFLRPETRGVVLINHDAAGEDIFLRVGGQRQGGLLLPVHQVLRRRVAPRHVPPRVAGGIVLIEQVIDAFMENHPVGGVVHPVFRWRVVVSRTKVLASHFRCRRRWCHAGHDARKCQARQRQRRRRCPHPAHSGFSHCSPRSPFIARAQPHLDNVVNEGKATISPADKSTVFRALLQVDSKVLTDRTSLSDAISSPTRKQRGVVGSCFAA